jgi:tricarballylate dehydrogenase
VLEHASEDESGGNSRFTAGAFRCVCDGVDDLRALVPNLTDEQVANTDFDTYTQDIFFDDMGRVTEYRTIPTYAIRPRERAGKARPLTFIDMNQ